MFNNNKINNSRYVKNARDAHIAFGANPALVCKQHLSCEAAAMIIQKYRLAAPHIVSGYCLLLDQSHAFSIGLNLSCTAQIQI